MSVGTPPTVSTINNERWMSVGTPPTVSTINNERWSRSHLQVCEMACLLTEFGQI